MAATDNGRPAARTRSTAHRASSLRHRPGRSAAGAAEGRAGSRRRALQGELPHPRPSRHPRHSICLTPKATARALKACGARLASSRPISPVSISARSKAGCVTSACRKAALVFGPAIDRRRPARGRARAIACLAIGTAGDQLGDHRIVEGRDDRALLARPKSTRKPVRLVDLEVDDRADRRQEALGRVLGVEARLDGVARTSGFAPAPAAASRRRPRAAAIPRDRGR